MRRNGAEPAIDYVHPTAITAWQLIGTCLGIFFVIVVGAWTIVINEAANNKNIADDLKQNYVTRSNHEDLVNRFVDFRNDTISHLNLLLPRKAFEDFLTERNKLIDGMREDIKGAVTRVEQGLSSRASTDQIANLQAQISQLREEARRHAEQDVSKFATKDEMLAHAESDKERLQGLRREIDALKSQIK